jgi:hypothetical protein
MQFDAKFISTAWSGLTALAGVWLGQRLASRSTERQRVWNQTRDTFASLLSAISELDLVAGSLGMYLAMEQTEHTLNEVSKIDNRFYDVVRDFGRAADVGRLFLGTEAIKILDDILGSIQTERGKTASELSASIQKNRPRLIEAARKEMGSRRVSRAPRDALRKYTPAQEPFHL